MVMLVAAAVVVAWGDGCGGRWERRCHWGWSGGGGGASSSMLGAGVVVSGEVCWAVVVVRYVEENIWTQSQHHHDIHRLFFPVHFLEPS